MLTTQLVVVVEINLVTFAVPHYIKISIFTGVSLLLYIQVRYFR